MTNTTPLNIGILAHVDAGKTTLSEALLYASGTLKKIGRVDHKDTFLDTDDLEILNDILKISEATKTIELEKNITEINVEKKGEYYLYIEDENKKIYIGEAKNLTNKMLYIKKMLENEKENAGTFFVNGDINEGFKPYFRPEM